MAGSLIIFEVADTRGRQDWAANDPYVKAGLFAASAVAAMEGDRQLMRRGIVRN